MPVCRGLRGTSCNFVEGARPMFAGPCSDCRRWIKIGLPPRLPESVPECPGHGTTPFRPFLAKKGALDGIWCRDSFFQYLHTDSFYGSQYRCLIFWFYYIRRKGWGSLSDGSSTGPHITSSPPFSPTQERQRRLQATGGTVISRSSCYAAHTRH